MLVVLAKLGSAEMMGQFALGFAVSAPLSPREHDLRDVLVTDVRKGDHRFGDYLALRLITALAGLLVTAGVAGLAATHGVELVEDPRVGLPLGDESRHRARRRGEGHRGGG